jgi:hypothetical protein
VLALKSYPGKKIFAIVTLHEKQPQIQVSVHPLIERNFVKRSVHSSSEINETSQESPARHYSLTNKTQASDKRLNLSKRNF